MCVLYSDEAASSETLVADLREFVAARRTPEGGRSTSAPPASPSTDRRTTAERDWSDPPRRRTSPPPCADNTSCSAREAILRSAHVSALLAAKHFHWSVISSVPAAPPRRAVCHLCRAVFTLFVVYIPQHDDSSYDTHEHDQFLFLFNRFSWNFAKCILGSGG